MLLEQEEEAEEGIVERRPDYPADIDLAVDFDLMLVGRRQPFAPWTVLAEADSPGLLEINEGLFYSTSESYSEVEVWRVVPAAFSACDKKFNHLEMEGEPSALSLLRWGWPLR